MRQKLTIVICLLSLITFFTFLWWNQAVKSVNPTNKESITFTIKRSEGIRNIADRLFKQNLIRSPLAFFLLVRLGNFDNKIQAGDFQLKPSMDLFTLTNTLTHGITDTWITIPEGWRNEEIALKLSKELNIPEKEFLKEAHEGYMFPDTYLVPKEATSQAVANIFFDNFHKKVSPEVKEKIKQKGFTLDEVLSIASLVEREAKFPKDRPLVASVILNRLKEGMKLDIDATIQYALGYQPNDKSWWKKELTIEDLEINSSHNTYKNAGLPPSPIANPGLLAIIAVIDAPKTEYFYYISDKQGKNHFAKTIEEHNINISKYLNK